MADLPKEFSLFIKRDDLHVTGSTLSGNKVQRLRRFFKLHVNVKYSNQFQCWSLFNSSSNIPTLGGLGLNEFK